MLIYGPPKVGKTCAVASLPDTLILELEPGGADYFPARAMNIAAMAELDMVLDELTRARQSGTPVAPRIAIDTIDVVEEWCDPAALAEYKATVMGKTFEGTSILELPQGAGYFRLREKMGEMLWRFTQAADEVILIAHVRDRLLGRVGGDVLAQDVDLTGKIRNIVCARCSAVGFMRRDFQGTLWLNFKTTDTVNCGSRCEHLRGQEFAIGTAVAGGAPRFDWSKVYLPPLPPSPPQGSAPGPAGSTNNNPPAPQAGT